MLNKNLPLGSATRIVPQIVQDNGDTGAAVVRDAKRPRSNRALWVSAAAWVGGGAIGGGLNLLVTKFLPKYAGAASPVINVTTDVIQSPGRLARETLTNPITAWIYAFASKGSETAIGTSFGQAIGPKLGSECVAAYQVRGKVDTWVINQLTEFTVYVQTVEAAAREAKAALQAGDVMLASRILGGAMYFDWGDRGELSPEGSPRMYEYLFICLSTIFSRLPKEQVETLKEGVRHEAVRLNGGKDDGLVSFCNATLQGITTGDTPPQLISPWTAEQAAKNSDVVNGKHVDARAWVGGLLDQYFTEHVKASGWREGLKTARLRRAVTKMVAKNVKVLEAERGRPATSEEVWRMTVNAFGEKTGSALETRAALLSFGAYAVIGVGSALGNQAILKHTPAWARSGVNAVVYTMFNYLLFVGGFFIDKLSALGSAIGYSGGQKASLGKALERELRNNSLRIRTADARQDVIHSYFLNLTRMMQVQAIDLGHTIKSGDMDEAAAQLAGLSTGAHTTNYQFWPYLEAMIRLYRRLGPNFDGITEAQRKEILDKAEQRLLKQGVTPEQLASYHRPLMNGLLTENVQVKA